ncbi:MAG: LemA family protein [Geobacteraceae bacterium]|nr:LemA family protein [Geobacteraceae bacterium]
MVYNTASEVFPAVLIAGSFRFTPASLLEIETAERSAPRVSFA